MARGILTLTGAGSSYSGHTIIAGGVLSFKGANALGTGEVTLAAGTELNSAQTVTLTNDILFGSGGPSTVSAAAGTTLTLISLNLSINGSAVFGSAGHTGVVPSGGRPWAVAVAAGAGLPPPP